MQGVFHICPYRKRKPECESIWYRLFFPVSFLFNAAVFHNIQKKTFGMNAPWMRTAPYNPCGTVWIPAPETSSIDLPSSINKFWYNLIHAIFRNIVNAPNINRITSKIHKHCKPSDLTGIPVPSPWSGRDSEGKDWVEHIYLWQRCGPKRLFHHPVKLAFLCLAFSLSASH